jgi:hypothetical protein
MKKSANDVARAARELLLLLGQHDQTAAVLQSGELVRQRQGFQLALQPRALDRVAQRANHQLRVEPVLQQIVLRAAAHRLDPSILVEAAGEDHDGHAASAISYGVEVGETHAIGEPEIEQHRVDVAACQSVARFAQAMCDEQLDGEVARLAHRFAQQSNVAGVVLDQQDPHAQSLGRWTMASQKPSIERTTSMNLSSSTGLVMKQLAWSE